MKDFIEKDFQDITSYDQYECSSKSKHYLERIWKTFIYM